MKTFSLNSGVGWAGRFHLFLRKIADTGRSSPAAVASSRRSEAAALSVSHSGVASGGQGSASKGALRKGVCCCRNARDL